MIQKLNISIDQYIVYDINIYDKSKPYIVYAHGLGSDMNSKKALYLKNFCEQQKFNFIRFDNLGHGQSSGNFADNNINTCLGAFELVLEKLVPSKAIVIGSSMGGWLAFAAALGKTAHKIIGLIGLAVAIDFTQDFWDCMNEQQRKNIFNLGKINIIGRGNIKYELTYQQITEAIPHLILNRSNLNFGIPIHLIHGIEDDIVPYSKSIDLATKIDCQNLIVKLIKTANHRLSRIEDIQIITNSISEIALIT